MSRPVIITEPGEYRTRNSRRVSISAIDGKGSASCSGYLWRMFRGKMKPKHYDIWQPDGSFLFIGEHALDIVGKWEGET